MPTWPKVAACEQQDQYRRIRGLAQIHALRDSSNAGRDAGRGRKGKERQTYIDAEMLGVALASLEARGGGIVLVDQVAIILETRQVDAEAGVHDA